MAEIIDIDIRPGARKYFVSSEQYLSGLITMLSMMDLEVTLGGRYSAVLQQIEGSRDPGFIIAYTAAHHEVAAALVLGYAFVGLYALYGAALDIAATAKKKSSSQQIKLMFDEQMAKLQKDPATQLTPEEQVLFETDEFCKLRDINYYLKKALESDQYLVAKYDRNGIKVTEDGKRLRLALVSETPKQTFLEKGVNNVRDFLTPFWVGLSTASFAYWIIWIGAAFFTGVLAVGVAGVSAGVAFGVPGALGLMYPLIKGINYIRNNFFKERTALDKEGDVRCPDKEKKTQAHYDANTLMQRALDLRNADMARMVINTERAKYAKLNGHELTEEKAFEYYPSSDFDEEVLYAVRSGKKKAAVEFVSTVVGLYVSLQYACWIVTDFLCVVGGIAAAADPTPLVGMIVASCMLAAAVFAGIAQALKVYTNAAQKKEALEKLELQENLRTTQNTLMNTLRGKMQEITLLKQQVAELEKNCAPEYKMHVSTQLTIATLEASSLLVPPPPPAPLWRRALTGAYDLVQGGMTAVFVLRTLIVVGTSSYTFPFILGLAPTLAFPPVTIAILVAGFFAFGAFKVYQAHQNRKKAEAEQLLLEGPEKLAKARQEIDTADCVIKMLKEKQEFLTKSQPQSNGVAKNTDRNFSIATTVVANLERSGLIELTESSSNSSSRMFSPRPSVVDIDSGVSSGSEEDNAIALDPVKRQPLQVAAS